MNARSFLPILIPVLVTGQSTGANEASFEIIGHRARIQLFPSQGVVHCLDTVIIRRLVGEWSTLQFGIQPQLKIERVIVGNDEIPFERNRDGFSIDGSQLKDESEFVVQFSGRPGDNPDLSRFTPARALLRGEAVLVRGTRKYQYVRLSVVVPQGWEAVAVGKLESTNTVADSTEFTWVSTDTISDIGWISAGEYRVTSRRVGSIDFSAYLFPEDSTSAQSILDLAESTIRFYSEQFSHYRFPKLAIVEVENWLGGPIVLGAAIPSVILVKQASLTTNDELNKAEVILPHEIAHQWWPQTVFIREEDAALLSEGICEYASRLYNESVGTKSQRSGWKSHPLLHSLLMRALRGKEVPLNRSADLRALPTHYLKAAYIHHMLRGIVGDETLRLIYREFAVRFQAKNAGLDEFQAVAEEFYRKPLGWFFNQWVKETGLPRLRLYNVRRTQEGNDWVVRGRLRLVGYKPYTMPVAVGAVTTTVSTTTSTWMGRDSTGTVRNDLPFEIRTPSEPLRVIVDPDGGLLKLQKMPVRLSDLREPASGLMIIGTKRLADRLLEFARRDSAELEQSGWSISIKPDTATTLADYRGERVFVYGGPSMNSVATQLARRFPVACDDRKCLWNGKVYEDTVLAVTQIIENPFQDQSLLCWLVPLGDAAVPILRPVSASAIVVRKGEVEESWTWDVKDEDLEFDFKN